MRNGRGSMSEQGVMIEQTGPNGWTIVGAGAFVGIALVIIALALLSISQYVGVAVIVAAAGQFVLASCTGAARIVEARGRAQAALNEAWWANDRQIGEGGNGS